MKAVFQYIKNLGVPRLRWVSLLSLALFLPIHTVRAQNAILGFLGDTAGSALASLMNFFFYITVKVVNVIASLLDFSVQYFVLEMAELVNDIGAIDGLWQQFRDLGNIVFIGVLLYIAIRTILDVGNSFNTKRLLIRLVIVALFVNFSLFATKAIVDTSNIVALQFYNSITVDQCEGSECNISNFFAKSVSLSSLQSPEALTQGGVESEDGSSSGLSTTSNLKIALARLMGIVFMAVVGFVLGAMAFLLAIRFVVLILLMIASPLAFIALILPSVDLGEKWFHQLLNQSFFAPALFAMIYVTARIARGLNTGTVLGNDASGDLLEAVISPNAGDNFGVVIVFFIMTLLMASTLVIAKKIGGIATEKSLEWGKSVRNFGLRRVSGTAALAGRQTIGRVSKRFADSDWLKDKADNSRFYQSVLRTADTTSKKTFDAKGIKKVGKSVGKQGLAKGGFVGGKKRKDEKAKRTQELIEAESKEEMDELQNAERDRERQGRLNKFKEKYDPEELGDELEEKLEEYGLAFEKGEEGFSKVESRIDTANEEAEKTFEKIKHQKLRRAQNFEDAYEAGVIPGWRTKSNLQTSGGRWKREFVREKRKGRNKSKKKKRKSDVEAALKLADEANKKGVSIDELLQQRDDNAQDNDGDQDDSGEQGNNSDE
jgi:hypothetical protein